ncbi:MAG TPA: hypothetical protein GXZ90_06225 [Clostridiales bacterium]|nr:hypothetical protein [Clostridiales bacterium]
MGFNYEDLYEKGQDIYYLRVLSNLHIKEVLFLETRTIYPDVIIGLIPNKGISIYIDINEKDNIFDNRKDAMKKYKTIKFK